MVKNGKNIPLKFKYDDSLTVNIQLDKVYHNTENYTIYIDYTSKPNELKQQGSAAITDAKGLYFINPDGTEKDKPTQIWTQGESESSSCWFPTIDKTSQKTTDEISMTVRLSMLLCLMVAWQVRSLMAMAPAPIPGNKNCHTPHICL